MSTQKSNSSFILAFKDNDDYLDFMEKCEDYYEDLKKFLKKVQKYPDSKNKEIAIRDMRSAYTKEKRKELAKKQLKRDDFASYPLYADALKQLMSTEEIKSEAEKELDNTDFEEKKSMIEDAYLILYGMIWESEGGALAWAIKNGFLEDIFAENCVSHWNE
jgi:uncharacterized protein (DUF1919 family)